MDEDNDNNNDNNNNNDNMMLPEGEIEVGDSVFDAGIGDVDQFIIRCDDNPSPRSLIPSNEALKFTRQLSITGKR